MTAADDKFCDIFPSFRQKVRYDILIKIVWQQTILMKYHTLFIFLGKKRKIEIVVSSNYRWRFKGETQQRHVV